MSGFPQASDQAGSAAPSVSSELEEIFVAATGLPSSYASWRPAAGTPRGPSQAARRRLPVGALGAAAAMILAGASAFAIAYSAPTSPGTSASAGPARPTLSIVTAAAAPAAPTSPDAASAAASARVGPVSGGPRPEPAAERTRAHVRAPSSRRPGQGDLMLADQQLRRAYARAVSAGVPRPILVDYRNRWADLRHEASWRPDRVVLGYRAMAGDLTRMAQPPRRDGGRGSLREARAW
jgi:hypothetical protein